MRGGIEVLVSLMGWSEEASLLQDSAGSARALLSTVTSPLTEQAPALQLGRSLARKAAEAVEA